MKTVYKSIIGFLYRNYCGTRQVKIFGRMYTATKASRIFYPFMVVWGLTHTFQVETQLHHFTLGSHIPHSASRISAHTLYIITTSRLYNSQFTIHNSQLQDFTTLRLHISLLNFESLILINIEINS
jgi:hypothetical protein